MSLEILVPAGNPESLRVAVNCDADAVYLGGSRFSARANAVNFSDDELFDGVGYAHVRGVKVYAALNTLIEDSRFGEAFEFAKFCYESGVDALIVQDLGVLSMLKQAFPDFTLNASTQMTIHNLKGVKAAERAGFSRVVLSRELSEGEIAEICRGAKAEIEVFAHGALCMSYSGQCLMSSFIGGRSGNRGACAQPCRLPYTLLDENGRTVCENKYLLSLKDLCLLDEISALKRAGVSSLKIEGRMKNSAYAAMTASLYDKYRNGGSVKREDAEDLQSVFSRNGFTKGYFENNTGRHMLNFDSDNDGVYEKLTQRARKRAEELEKSSEKKISVSASFSASVGQRAVMCVWDGDGNGVTEESVSFAEKAERVSLTEERVKTQLTKTGGTPFEIDDLITDLGEGVSLPVKEINEMRRNALCELERRRERRRKKADGAEFSFGVIKSKAKPLLTASALTYEQARLLGKYDFARIYVPADIYGKFSDERYFAVLPEIERHGYAEGFERISVSNFSQIYDTAEVKHGGFRLNVFNSPAVKLLAEAGFSSVTLSAEMNIGQIRAVSKDIPAEAIVYGHIPVMTAQNCIVKSAHGGCACGGVHYLKDRKGVLFPVISRKGACTSVVLNSAPIYMGDRAEELASCGLSFACLSFTTENEEEIKDIIKRYENGSSFERNFTRGHFYRGV